LQTLRKSCDGTLRKLPRTGPDKLQDIGKTFHRATLWETLTWYAKKGAAKIGVKWD
jgi:hypothetical protein